MTPPNTILKKLVSQSPLIHRADAIAAGVTSNSLTELTREGILERIGRGLYQVRDRLSRIPMLLAANAKLAEG